MLIFGIGHFQTWLGCFLSEMATARFGEEHAFPNEVWLSPNPRDLYGHSLAIKIEIARQS